MSKAIPNPDLSPNGNGLKHLAPENEDRAKRMIKAAAPPDTPKVDFWGDENPLCSGRETLADHDQVLLQSLGIGAAQHSEPNGTLDPEHLLRENEELRSIIAELKQQENEIRQQEENKFLERQKEFESILEEKSEIIRSLHQKAQDLEARPVVPATPKEEELLALSEELERERCQLQQERRQLEEERQQLEEDEQSMTKQMREMEVQMARERADFARQRNELNRIQEEIRREMENIERNGLLNQRLFQLRQRSQDVGHSTSGSSTQAPQPEAPDNSQGAKTPPEGRRRESFLGRLFG
jgi:DNA repair exonuclease SbcCD ATPase subunit